VYEIDGRPAFEIYRDYAKANGVELTHENAGPYMITYELGLYLFGELWEARAPLKVNPDGSLMCAGDLARGQHVCILQGSPDQMLSAARQAAREAREGLRGAKAAGVLVFDCICRGILLKDQFAGEIAAIRSELGDVPVAGFLTYGEIAHFGGATKSWHNTTAVVVAIPA
jgi:methyl-accepting chemotaxis protein